MSRDTRWAKAHTAADGERTSREDTGKQNTNKLTADPCCRREPGGGTGRRNEADEASEKVGEVEGAAKTGVLHRADGGMRNSRKLRECRLEIRGSEADDGAFVAHLNKTQRSGEEFGVIWDSQRPRCTSLVENPCT